MFIDYRFLLIILTYLKQYECYPNTVRYESSIVGGFRQLKIKLNRGSRAVAPPSGLAAAAYHSPRHASDSTKCLLL